MNSELTKTAIDWWTKTISNPKFDNGETGGIQDIASLTAMMLAYKSKPDTEIFSQFSEALEDVITSSKENNVILTVDYHPQGLLADAITQSGISSNIFPWKTSMWINFDENTIDVRNGYNANVERIFPVSEHKM